MKPRFNKILNSSMNNDEKSIFIYPVAEHQRNNVAHRLIT